MAPPTFNSGFFLSIDRLYSFYKVWPSGTTTAGHTKASIYALWEAMVSMLQDNNCGIDKEEGVLVEIMACAARKASGVHPPAGGKVIA